MPAATLYALCGAVLIGIGVYGFITRAHLLRRVLAFNVIGSGLFLFLGALGARSPGAGADPVPQALIITGIVVALSLTALAVALVLRHVEETGRAVLAEEEGGERRRDGERLRPPGARGTPP